MEKPKAQGEKGKWKSLRQALKCNWIKHDIEALQRRLAGFRDELVLNILVALRQVNYLEQVDGFIPYKVLGERWT